MRYLILRNEHSIVALCKLFQSIEQEGKLSNSCFVLQVLFFYAFLLLLLKNLLFILTSAVIKRVCFCSYFYLSVFPNLLP